jgi:hypothetical protein
VTRAPFEPLGRMSIADACIELIRETPEKDGFPYDVAVTEIRERTGIEDVRRGTVMSAIRIATDRLHVEGIPGVENVGGGWQRMDPAGMVRYIATRSRRGQRQFRRAVTAVGATDKARLEFKDRHQLDHHERTARMVADMNTHRAKRQRPLPPAASG